MTRKEIERNIEIVQENLALDLPDGLRQAQLARLRTLKAMLEERQK